MAHKFTQFANAETATLLENGLVRLQEVNTSVVRALQTLKDGNFVGGFDRANEATNRLKSATDFINRNNLSQLYVQLNRATVNVRELWTHFQAMETGRANFSGAIDTAKEKLADLKNTVSDIKGDVKDVVELGTEVGSEVMAAVNAAKSLFPPPSGPNVPDGTLVAIPSCMPQPAYDQANAGLRGIFPIIGLGNIVNPLQELYGIRPCQAGETPRTVYVTQGSKASVAETKRQLDAEAAAKAGSAPAPVYDAGARLTLAMNKAQQDINKGRVLANDGGSSSSSGLLTVGLLGAAGWALKMLLSK